MKIALITDTHFGARNDSEFFADYFRKFYQEIFFPYLKDNNIDTIIHLGDLIDRRKYINYKSLRNFVFDFVNPVKENNLKCHVLIGNHDTYWKDTNSLNSPELLIFPCEQFSLYSKPEVVSIAGNKFLFLPWITDDNKKDSLKLIKAKETNVIFGHLEIAGFSMYKNCASHEGINKKQFKDYDFVASGHFHHKSDKDNIHYLGAPYQITWSDYNDDRGFHIFDTDDNSIEYIKNPLTMFEKIIYEEGKVPSIENVGSKYVKLIVEDYGNPKAYDSFIEKLYKKLPLDIDVINEVLVEGNVNDDINFEVDTLDFLRDYIENVDNYNAEEKKNIKNIIQEIYSEAIDD